MDAARELAALRLSGTPLDFAPASGPAGEEAAYALQHTANHLLSATLGHIAGLKIGCTTAVMRAFLGIDNPAAGEIFSSTISEGRARLSHGSFRKLGIECEIAVSIGRDVEPGLKPPAAADVVASVHAAAEIVDDRYTDYKAIGINWLIADNFFNAGAVVGPPITNWRSLDLTTVRGRTVINGEVKGEGLGVAVMGHPFHALDWLIARRLASGSGIAKGSICLLGSVVETKWLAQGDEVEIELDGLGAPLNISVA